ncbi:MAG: hypothetical protein ACI9CF_000736 [Candidatus Omnitrophota bacterium]
MNWTRFWQGSFGRSIRFSCIAIAALSIILVFTSLRVWLLGVWVAMLWLFLNSLSMAKIYFLAMDGQVSKQWITNCLIKFPLLYLLGLAFLVLPGMRFEGVLLTLTIYMLIMGWVLATAKPLDEKS